MNVSKFVQAVAFIAIATLIGASLGRLASPEARASFARIASTDTVTFAGHDATTARQCVDITKQLQTAFAH